MPTGGAAHCDTVSALSRSVREERQPPAVPPAPVRGSSPACGAGVHQDCSGTSARLPGTPRRPRAIPRLVRALLRVMPRPFRRAHGTAGPSASDVRASGVVTRRRRGAGGGAGVGGGSGRFGGVPDAARRRRRAVRGAVRGHAFVPGAAARRRRGSGAEARRMAQAPCRGDESSPALATPLGRRERTEMWQTKEGPSWMSRWIR